MRFKHGVSGAARHAALAERRRGCSVGIREFRAGLAEIISSRQPVAVTRHGQTVGFFIPTVRPAQADLQALRDAADKLEAVMLLTDDQEVASTATPQK